jgi:fibronectin-binding autotransporter adhesin
LTIQSTLTFNSDATYEVGLNTKGAIADEVVANGVTISGAQFSLVDRGRLALPPGTVFTVIDNTAATPIASTFSNLADGSTFPAHGNTFQVSYEGGDGNDLTLTVQ